MSSKPAMDAAEMRGVSTAMAAAEMHRDGARLGGDGWEDAVAGTARGKRGLTKAGD